MFITLPSFQQCMVEEHAPLLGMVCQLRTTNDSNKEKWLIFVFTFAFHFLAALKFIDWVIIIHHVSFGSESLLVFMNHYITSIWCKLPRKALLNYILTFTWTGTFLITSYGWGTWTGYFWYSLTTYGTFFSTTYGCGIGTFTSYGIFFSIVTGTCLVIV